MQQHGRCKMDGLRGMSMIRSKVLICSLSAILLLALLAGCGAEPGYSGALRGDDILYLRLQNGQQESIVLDKQRLASRSFDPVTVRTHVNRVVIPEPLWTDLENLRQSWCAQPPTSVSRIPDDAAFEVVFQCHQLSGFNNTVYFVRPTELPPPLRALIDIVPSTSERLIVP